MLYPILSLIILGYTITKTSKFQHEGRVHGIRWKGLEILGWANQDFKALSLSITKLWALECYTQYYH